MSVKIQDMHWEDIKSEVRKKGKSIAQLSREAGLNPDTMRNTGRSRLPKYQRVIANFLEKRPEEIWPSRY